MRPEALYLQDIVDATEAIGRFLQGIESEEFMQSELIQSAILQKLSVIGEAAGRVSKEVREQHPQIE